MNDGAIAQVSRTGLVARGSSGFKDSSGLFLSRLCFTSLSSPSGSPSETLEAGRAVTRVTSALARTGEPGPPVFLAQWQERGREEGKWVCQTRGVPRMI